MMDGKKWYLRTKDETFGPETTERLIEWARLGRVQPGQEISEDGEIWRRVEDVPFLDMRFSIDIGDGNPRGPFNRAAAEALLASGRLPMAASIVETREPFPEEPPDRDEAPVVALTEQPLEEVAENAEISSAGTLSEGAPEETPEVKPEVTDVVEVVKAEDPVSETDEASVEETHEESVSEPAEKLVEEAVERVVEKIVEVPVEKVVEKVIEVPVEKIVEKIVVDETRVKELEGFLEEERRHTAELQNRLDESSKNAAEAAKTAVERENGLRAECSQANERAARLETSLKDAADRESKLSEQVRHLEDDLRRLPQAASEVADIQAAIFAIMKSEAEELDGIMVQEKREFEEAKRRFVERSDRLMERRRTMLKRAGANIEDMTRKALLERPEDPRTAQLRKELSELSHAHDRAMMDRDAKIRELTEELRQRKAEGVRNAEGMKDVTQLRLEVQELKERLQVREKELMVERQRNEELCRQQATKQQALLARLAALESPSIGNVASMETNQSREAKQVKLPGWMRLKR